MKPCRSCAERRKAIAMVAKKVVSSEAVKVVPRVWRSIVTRKPKAG